MAITIGDEQKGFRREALTPHFMEAGEEKVTASGALRTDGHFVHHEGELDDERHTSTWFDADALFRDTSVVNHVIPAMVHKLPLEVLCSIDVVVAVATGGVGLALQTCAYIDTERPREMEALSCLFLRHAGKEDYGFSNGDKLWIADWTEAHKHKPRCLVLDDVFYFGTTTTNVVEYLRTDDVKVIVTAILHAAGTNQTRPKLLNRIPQGCFFDFDPGPAYQRRDCPMCKAGMPKTIV